MFARANRLPGPLVKEILRRGRVWRGPNLTLYYLVLPSGPARLGAAVAVRQVKKAVWRNRIKRRLRAALRAGLGTLDQPVGVMVFAGARARVIPFPELVAEIVSLWKKVRIN